MITTIILEFLIPWFLAIYLIKRDMQTIVTIGPAVAFISIVFNEFGMYLEWWSYIPKETEVISSFIADIGIYLVSGCFMIYFIKLNKTHELLIILAVSLTLTCLEILFLMLDKIKYDNGWNIGWTFISYLLAYSLIYGYYKLFLRYSAR